MLCELRELKPSRMYLFVLIRRKGSGCSCTAQLIGYARFSNLRQNWKRSPRHSVFPHQKYQFNGLFVLFQSPSTPRPQTIGILLLPSQAHRVVTTFHSSRTMSSDSTSQAPLNTSGTRLSLDPDASGASSLHQLANSVTLLMPASLGGEVFCPESYPYKDGDDLRSKLEFSLAESRYLQPSLQTDVCA